MKSSSKTLDLRNEIRRKYMDELLKKEREAFERHRSLNEQEQEEISAEKIAGYVSENNIDSLYQSLLVKNNISKLLPIQGWWPLLSLLTHENNIKNTKSIHLLAIIVMHCCSRYQ